MPIPHEPDEYIQPFQVVIEVCFPYTMGFSPKTSVNYNVGCTVYCLTDQVESIPIAM